MKTIFITGANKGIGFETARQLLQAGHEVIIGVRDLARGMKAMAQLQPDGQRISQVQIDVSSSDSIARAGEELKSRFDHLDVIINNAAIMEGADRSLIHSSAVTIERTIQTNGFGPLWVTRTLAPLLGQGGIVIMVSSGGGSMTDPVGGWSPAYCVSKTMLNALTRHLDYELSPRGIRVNAICPGWVQTDMGGAGAQRPVNKGAETIVWMAEDGTFLSGRFFRDKEVIPW